MKEIMNVKKVAKYLEVSMSFIYKKTSNKEIPFYKPTNGKIYFRKEEIDKWLLTGRVATVDEKASQLLSNLKTI